MMFGKPRPAQMTPQGFVTQSGDPNTDNVDLWGNWDVAQPAYAAGNPIGHFVYILKAIPPGPMPCQ
jgi:hypothetical protein